MCNSPEPTKDIFFVRFNREFALTEFVITEFDCILYRYHISLKKTVLELSFTKECLFVQTVASYKNCLWSH